jgi:hypothetical protein
MMGCHNAWTHPYPQVHNESRIQSYASSTRPGEYSNGVVPLDFLISYLCDLEWKLILWFVPPISLDSAHIALQLVRDSYPWLSSWCFKLKHWLLKGILPFGSRYRHQIQLQVKHLPFKGWVMCVLLYVSTYPLWLYRST